MPDTSSKNAADPIILSLFANRHMSIAEAMGRSLQQTSISTNIKERLDFSCAVFAPNGDLIANAPHLPVHLGSMSFAVRFQIQHLKGDLQDGDVLLTNHPVAGGSHLPDVTVITPVFREGEIIFFTASRGHHADIGGILPGSMPPTSKTLFEEGAQVVSLKIVKQGKYQRDEFLRYFVEEPGKHPGCSGCRSLRDVESDLQAQIAANAKGAGLIGKMIDEYGLEMVQEYMLHIRDNAELAVRNLLKHVAQKHGTELHALDYLDDGTPIELHITIDRDEGSAVFDFEGTGPESIGNLNTPTSVTHSAIIYCLRCLVDMDIPLNQGCLVPIEVKIPAGTILSPSPTAAVVGGNVCTSQRVTDVVLKAFHGAAASQGDCNNATWGNDSFGFYETIAGGSGAGPTWHGTSGVHTHMTNTRITDVETMERRYPVLVHEFGLRHGSGGKGHFNGGDGCVRDVEFLESMQVSILSERRVFEPFGMEGGGNGARGRNTWIKRCRAEDGDLPDDACDDENEAPPIRRINLGGKQTVKMGPGDRIRIETPGAGAWGRIEDDANNGETTERSSRLLKSVVPSSLYQGALRGSFVEKRMPDF